jgi:hypothetical protein
VAGNGQQPRGKATAPLVERSGAAPEAEEDLLDDIVSLARTEEVGGYRVDGPAVSIVEQGKGGQVAVGDAPDEGFVAGLR